MSLYEQLALLQRQITDLRRESEAQKLISKLALLDEDNFSSDSATAAASQQSIKAYAAATFGAYTAWTAYTVSWTAATTNPAIGSGTLSGRYSQVGKLVSAKIRMVAAADTTFGTGNWGFSLPVAGVVNSMGSYYARDQGTADYYGVVLNDGSTTVLYRFPQYGLNVFRMHATTPFTWANTDSLDIFITYEAA